MNISQLIEALNDPSVTLTMSEKLMVGVSVAILAMAIVFLVLIIIAGIISLLQRDNTSKKPQVAQIDQNSANSIVEVQEESSEDIGELVSVITAAIAASTGNSTNNIVVRKIQRSNNTKSSWERMAKNTTK